MATGSKTTRFAFATRLTDVATATAIASATRFDFTAITIYVPETTRTIKRAELIFTFDQAVTAGASRNIEKWLLGVKINAVAFDDVTTTSDATDTGECEQVHVTRDVTSYFVTNDPGTSSFTLQAGVQVQMSGAADAIRNITCELMLTYEYDTTATTHIKTVEIPIQGHASRLGTTYAEIGTDGTTPASASQLPKLTSSGLLPESSITIRDQFLVVTGNRGATATTDLTMTMRLDGATDLVRATCEMNLASAAAYKDILDKSLMPSTTAAHAVEAKSSSANSFQHVSAVLVVTYEFDPASTRILNSVQVPLYNERSILSTVGGSPTASDRLTATLDVQEPGTITMVQSGVVVLSHNAGNAVTRSISATGQTARPFTFANALVIDGMTPLIMRTDHSSSTWALARGVNNLRVDIADSVVDEKLTSGYAIINYTSDKAAGGVSTHNHTTYWCIKTLEGTTVLSTTVTPTAPSIPESTYRISGMMLQCMVRNTISTMSVGIQRKTGEDGGSGWYWRSWARSTNSNEIGSKHQIYDATRIVKDGTPNAAGIDIETASRDYYFTCGVAGQTAQYQARIALTYHAITFAVAGQVTVNGVVYSGAAVKVVSLRSGEYYGKVIGTGTADGSGNFSIDVSESDASAFAWFEADSTNQGKSVSGTPGTSTFNITVNTSSGVPNHPLKTPSHYIG
jgi:hypothetical protein